MVEPGLAAPPERSDEAEKAQSESLLAQATGTDEKGILQVELPRMVESLLFVASSPAEIAQLARVFGVEEGAVDLALEELAAACVSERRGLMVQRKGDRVQLVTVPEAGPYIERFLGLDLTARLSQAALESLALIAYRQPITRSQIEAIRGVNCDGVLRTLLARGLVEPVGRLEQAGRPYLYGTTFQFLQYFGLDGLEQLPGLPEP